MILAWGGSGAGKRGHEVNHNAPALAGVFWYDGCYLGGQAMTQKRPVGRPRHYETPEDFEDKIHQFSEYCAEKKEPVTWTGLALFMGFSSRQSIDEYANYDGFSDVVKKAKTFVEWHYEMRLCGDKPTGAIFALKNMGWQDSQRHEHSGQIEQPLVVVLDGDDDEDSPD